MRWIWLLATLNVFLLLAGYYEYAERHWGSLTPKAHAVSVAVAPTPNEANPVVATVNGEGIRRDEVTAVLQREGGVRVLHRLVAQDVVMQAAAKAGLKLDDPDSVLAMQQATANLKSAAAVEVAGRSLQARLLLRKLLLKDITQAQEQAFYSEYKDELTQYDLSVILARRPEQAHKVSAMLSSGQDFATVATRIKSPNQGHLGYLTLAQITDQMGPDVAHAVLKAASRMGGKAEGPIKALGGKLFLKVGQVRTGFEDLKPSIDGIMAAAGKTALMRRLMAEAKIDYPVLAANLERQPRTLPSPSPTTEKPVFAPLPSGQKGSGAPPAATSTGATCSHLPSLCGPECKSCPSH